MRATIQAGHLAAALKSSVAPATTPMDVLRHASLTAHRDQLVIETTDGVVYLRTAVPAKVETEGQILLPAALLAPVAAAPGEIALRDTGELQRGRSRFRLPVRPASEWPGQVPEDWEPVDVDAEHLRDAIESVSHASADDSDLRAYLRGLHVVPGMVWASDAKSLAFARLDYTGPVLVIPGQPLRRIVGLLGEGARVEVARVSAGQAGALRITCGPQCITLRLLDSKPLDMPSHLGSLTVGDACATVRRADLLAAVRRFMPFATMHEGTKKAIPTIVLELAGGDLTVADAREESRESLAEALVESSGSWRAGIDAQRLIRALGAIGGELVCLHAPPKRGKSSNTDVWRLHPAGAAPADHAHFIAPLTL